MSNQQVIFGNYFMELSYLSNIYSYFDRNTKLNMDEKRSSPEIARSQKIENLIKKVAENKTRARLNNRYPSSQQSNNNLQVRYYLFPNQTFF